MKHSQIAFMLSCSFVTLLFAVAHKEGASVAYAEDNSSGVIGPVDLDLRHESPACKKPQPYRLYLPSAYDGTKAIPLLVAMHGTGGNQNKYFDHKSYGNGLYKSIAEKRGIAIICPLGTDPAGKPTDWQGLGENNVFMAIADVCQKFKIDQDRIICTGQSMGGSGTTYLCTQYPDFFAAGIPLASSYEHVCLMKNLRYVPFLFVQGEKDWPAYANDGPIPLSRELHRLNYNGELWMVPGFGHNTMQASTERVIDWALQQKRVRHPSIVTHGTFFPIHGRAYWIEIQEIENIGFFASVDARVTDNNRIEIKSSNASKIAVRIDPVLLDLEKPISISINSKEVFHGLCTVDSEVQLTVENKQWSATVGKKALRPYTAYRSHRIGTVDSVPDWSGQAEMTKGNFKADMVRDIAESDIAICTRGLSWGTTLHKGDSIYVVDLLNWIRPFDRAVVSFELKGSDLLTIIEDNIIDGNSRSKRLRVLPQVSGCRYEFDRSRPRGQRIISTDIDPKKVYRIACESQLLTRPDCFNLKGKFRKIEYETLGPTTISAAWRFIVKSDGLLKAVRDGRVKDSTPKSPQ